MAPTFPAPCHHASALIPCHPRGSGSAADLPFLPRCVCPPGAIPLAPWYEPPATHVVIAFALPHGRVQQLAPHAAADGEGDATLHQLLQLLRRRSEMVAQQVRMGR